MNTLLSIKKTVGAAVLFLETHVFTILASVASVFSPVKTVLLAAGFLIVMDLVTGIYVALRKKEPVTSAKMKVTIAKFLAYEAAVCIGYVMQHFLMGDAIPVVNVVGTFIALTEGKSVLENIENATGVTLVKAVMRKLERPEDDGGKS